MNEPAYHPGLEGVIAGETAISTIAGGSGLRYRGYAIEDLASEASFEEVAYLLLHGDLPTAEALHDFCQRLTTAAPLQSEILDFMRSIPRDTSIMDFLRTSASALAHFDVEADDTSSPAQLRKAERLLAQFPAVLAAQRRLQQGHEPVEPDPQKSFAANLLWMLRSEQPSSQLERAMDVSLTLYAEHEFNASTFTARVITSTLSDLHSSIAGAIGALKGPLHGGANERVMEVLEEVGTVENAEGWIRKALAEKRRIMGFGHRVYKEGDPRARFLKPLCQELAIETGHEKMEAMADVIERIVVEEKGLLPNLDWPSARLYHYMGLDVSIYTPLFVLSRVTGWSAHVIEQMENNRLIRPRSRYIGPDPRPWVPVTER
ncbi:MAG: citrate/2-methylcitrate synthase [Planctomycetota bacterium]|nr:citrate/2-methylcitrate synthase [Planctomycetota bacterium]